MEGGGGFLRSHGFQGERERVGSIVADIDTGDYRKLTAEGCGGGGEEDGNKTEP